MVNGGGKWHAFQQLATESYERDIEPIEDATSDIPLPMRMAFISLKAGEYRAEALLSEMAERLELVEDELAIARTKSRRKAAATHAASAGGGGGFVVIMEAIARAFS